MCFHVMSSLSKMPVRFSGLFFLSKTTFFIVSISVSQVHVLSLILIMLSKYLLGPEIRFSSVCAYTSSVYGLKK